MQMPMFIPAEGGRVLPSTAKPEGWSPTPVSQLPSWRDAKRVGYDLETYDPTLKKLGPGVRRDGRVIGISFAIEDGPAFYLPIGHSEDNLDPTHVWNYLRDQSKAFTGDLVGGNLQYDLDYTWQQGVMFQNVKRFLDIQIAEPLIDDLQDSYSLDNIAIRHQLPGKNEEMLREAAMAWGVDPKKDMHKIPGRFVAGYAIQDAILPLQIMRRQERLIDDQDLWKIFDLESRLLPVLVRMRRRGVAVDFRKLEEVEKWTTEQQHIALLKVHHDCGIRLGLDEVNKPEPLAKVLKAIGVDDIPLTPTTKKPSISKELLASIKHPVADAILRARRMDKLRNTFCKSVKEHAVNGRIHTSFNQLRMNKDEDGGDDGARYGRLSSTDPNLQQQPGRDPEIGPLWRSIYIPDEGHQWAAMDYSQQEPRMVVHFAVLCGLPAAAEMAHRFRTDLSTDNHTEMAKIAQVERKFAKEIFLGLCYGMGGAKLCKKLGKPTVWIHSQKWNKMIEVAGPEGDAILKQFDEKVPYVKLLAKLCENRAKERGYITTLLGRRCRFPKKEDGTFDWTHKAMNRLIQGSSADQTKLAVVTLDDEGMTPQLQIHDEVDDSVLDPAAAEKRADVMRYCCELQVPSKVDVELGNSWGDSM